MDKTLQNLSAQMTYSMFERPVAESKYIVLKTVNGKKHIKEYNFKLIPGSGPYIIHEEDIDEGSSVTAQERNSDHLLEEGVASRCNNLPVLAYKVDQLVGDAERFSRMQANARRLARPNAVRDIVNKLLEMLGN